MAALCWCHQALTGWRSFLGFTFAESSLMGSSSRFQVSDRRSGEKDPTLPFPLPIKKAIRRRNSWQDVGRFVLMPAGALGGPFGVDFYLEVHWGRLSGVEPFSSKSYIQKIRQIDRTILFLLLPLRLREQCSLSSLSTQQWSECWGFCLRSTFIISCLKKNNLTELNT